MTKPPTAGDDQGLGAEERRRDWGTDSRRRSAQGSGLGSWMMPDFVRTRPSLSAGCWSYGRRLHSITQAGQAKTSCPPVDATCSSPTLTGEAVGSLHHRQIPIMTTAAFAIPRYGSPDRIPTGPR
jgi:hypothetical protein